MYLLATRKQVKTIIISTVLNNRPVISLYFIMKSRCFNATSSLLLSANYTHIITYHHHLLPVHIIKGTGTGNRTGMKDAVALHSSVNYGSRKDEASR